MNSIEIFNFKNFGHLKIGNLGALNLIVGRNNTGKSTLLESISLLASGANIGWIKDLLEIRGINARFSLNAEQPDMLELENFCSLYHNRSYEAFKHEPIKIKTDEDNGSQSTSIEIKIVDLIEITDTDDNGNETRRRVIRDTDDNQIIIDGEVRPGLLITNNESKTIYTVGNTPRRMYTGERNIPFEYVRTAEFTGDKNPALFDKVALTPLEPVLIEALHIIDNRIEALNFLKDDNRVRPTPFAMRRDPDDNRVPYVVLQGTTEKYRLSTMGDGINRILTIILSMLNCRNGILLVDEFENGLHYSVQTGLWGLIGRLAQELNIQVFATTHSLDCIKSFLNATRDTGIGRLIRLEKRTNGEEIAVMYDEADELDYITDNNVETR